ncbi:hypothetical protein JB92DRAFT_1108707 [Gautieria morchelliformis]|nr:hypothetical protein JB92DRAFT_1108707 [Gautieria morchelliformis]
MFCCGSCLANGEERLAGGTLCQDGPSHAPLQAEVRQQSDRQERLEHTTGDSIQSRKDSCRARQRTALGSSRLATPCRSPTLVCLPDTRREPHPASSPRSRIRTAPLHIPLVVARPSRPSRHPSPVPASRRSSLSCAHTPYWHTVRASPQCARLPPRSAQRHRPAHQCWHRRWKQKKIRRTTYVNHKRRVTISNSVHPLPAARATAAGSSAQTHAVSCSRAILSRVSPWPWRPRDRSTPPIPTYPPLNRATRYSGLRGR